MNLRPLLLHNLSWKLLSLTLAILIWSGARLFMHDEIRPIVRPLQPLATRDFENIPIRVLTPPGDPTIWHVKPSSVLVRAGAEFGLIERLSEADPIVYVQPRADQVDTPATNRVEVRLPPAIRLVSVIPERVVVTASPPAQRPATQP